MKSERPVVALCGPSGVGKGYTKSKLLNYVPGLFAEPTVITTRPARPDDLGAQGRKAGVPEAEYQALVATGAVILDHQPFRRLDSPRYGFDKQSTDVQRPLLTEVHSSIVRNFHEEFNTRGVLVIGFLSTRHLLHESMRGRGDSMEDMELRLRMSELEQAELETAHAEGLISDLYKCDDESRGRMQNEAIAKILQFTGVYNG